MYTTLAIDYDGTLAHHGRVDEATREAIRRARDSGYCAVLVTGRELTDLFSTFPDYKVFDRIVAENGAVLCDPSHDSIARLAGSPPTGLVARLTSAGIPLSIGQSIVATVVPYDQEVLAAIRELGIAWDVIFNKGAVMALPAGITKATGLRAALAELGVLPRHTVAIGDAENDRDLFRECGFRIAVANALPLLKAEADLVTAGSHGAGVQEAIDRLLQHTLPIMEPR
jgi:hydroxymethylpyrimidine pyrophosphatase-like HAD family hydrolase